MNQALINLNADRNLKELKLATSIVKAMDAIGYGKLHIRQQVGAFLSTYEKNPSGKHTSTASLLVQHIRKINAEVDDVEQRLNAARSR